MALRFLPLLGADDTKNIELIYDWLQDLVDDFPNAVGAAIDPSVGEGGDNALTITETPDAVAYVPGTTLSVDNILSGHIDVSFAAPDRAADVVIEYKRTDADTYSRVTALTSPHRLSNLSVGSIYDIRVAGRAANNTLGPFTDAEIITITLEGAAATPPTNLVAIASFQTITLTWTASTGAVARYEIQRATDEDFTVGVTSFVSDSTQYVDDTGVTGATYFYRVRAVDSVGNLSDWSNVVTATTVGLRPGDLLGDHVHGLYRATGNGILTSFPLPDIAEYVEIVTKAGLAIDPFLYSLPSTRDRITFDVAPLAAEVIVAHYVIARLAS